MKHFIPLSNSKNIAVLAFVAFILLFASCAKEQDTAVDARDNFVGTWLMAETSKNFGQTSYTISISKSNADNVNIIVKNFYNLGTSTNTVVEVSGNNLSISSQTVSGTIISGSGTLSGKISWTYQTNDGVNKDNCTATSTKQ